MKTRVFKLFFVFFCLCVLMVYFARSHISEAQSETEDSKIKQNDIITYYRGLPILSENRWLVTVRDESGMIIVVSKLFLGTEYISLEDLKADWAHWSVDEQIGFTEALRTAQLDNIDGYLRFIMNNGNIFTSSTIALTVVEKMPPDESIPYIKRLINETELGEASNFVQAMTVSGHEDAIPVIQARLRALIKDPRIKEIPEITGESPIVFEAINCLHSLRQLGVSFSEMEYAINILSNTPSPAIRFDIQSMLESKTQKGEPLPRPIRRGIRD